MKTTLDYLFRVEPPWIYIGFAEPERKNWNPQHYYEREGVHSCVRRLRGKKMKTTNALMDEFGAGLQFFEGFGGNWPALGECLECLDEWMPASAYVLAVEDAEDVLRDEQPDQMVALLKTLHDAGEWWAKPIASNGRFNRNAIPFHVLLNIQDGFSSDTDRILRLADGSNVPVRR
ncbi:MAG: barstar family protein [Planctomycetia bacterium]